MLKRFSVNTLLCTLAVHWNNIQFHGCYSFYLFFFFFYLCYSGIQQCCISHGFCCNMSWDNKSAVLSFLLFSFSCPLPLFLSHLLYLDQDCLCLKLSFVFINAVITKQSGNRKPFKELNLKQTMLLWCKFYC